MKKIKNMNKNTKNNLITYGIVIVAFIVMQTLISTGSVSSLLEGLMVPLCIYIILAVSLNLVVGILGELSLGHAGFMCAGAFSSAFFSKCMKDVIENGTLRFILALLIGIAVAAVFGIIIGIPVLRLKERLRCAECGASLHRLGGKNRRADTLYLKCGGCGAVVTIPDDALLEEIARQVTEHSTPGPATYQPSGEVIRLTNAINRALESPNKPEEALSLILKGASARYDCCPPAPPTQEEARLLAVDQDHIRQVVSYITISAENVVAVAFR